MILDFISSANNLNYNVGFAKLFGLYSAVYLNLLLNLYPSRENDLIKISRDEIYGLSGIDQDKQLEVEENLISYNLLEVNKVRNSSNKNYYKLNVELLTNIVCSPNKDIEQILNSVQIPKKPATKSPSKVSKRAIIIDSLKSNIITQDEKCRNLLTEWIDAVMQKTGYLSKLAVQYMEQKIFEYSKNSITKARNLCEIAARLAYKDPQWVIKKYEEEKGINNNLVFTAVNQTEIDNNLNELKNYKGEVF